MLEKIFMCYIVLFALIFVLFFLVLGVYELIYEIFKKEKFNLYDKENNCLVPNPPKMDYWEIITKISAHKNISVTEAVKRYRELSGIPSNDNLKAVSIKRID